MSEFRFHSKLDLTILLGKKAQNARQLLEGLRTVPDSSIYYHTHRFLHQHHYMTPQAPNDMAQWVINSLNNDILGEQLSSVDVVQFDTIEEVRQRFIEVIEGHVAANGNKLESPPGEEFYFLACQTFVFPTPYVVDNLKEFLSVLERVTINSLYHHMFDARLRLGRGENDFSAWFRGLGKTELADEVKRFDPYAHTLEGLRKRIAVLVRRHD